MTGVTARDEVDVMVAGATALKQPIGIVRLLPLRRPSCPIDPDGGGLAGKGGCEKRMTVLSITFRL
jgi:hypothetical protein